MEKVFKPLFIAAVVCLLLGKSWDYFIGYFIGGFIWEFWLKDWFFPKKGSDERVE